MSGLIPSAPGEGMKWTPTKRWRVIFTGNESRRGHVTFFETEHRTENIIEADWKRPRELTPDEVYHAKTAIQALRSFPAMISCTFPGIVVEAESS